MMNRIAKYFRDYAFAGFALPAALILIVFGCISYGPVLARQDYPQTEAIVTQTELYEEAYYDTATETHHDATYRIIVQYSVDGKEYEEEYGVFPEMNVGTKIKTPTIQTIRMAIFMIQVLILLWP